MSKISFVLLILIIVTALFCGNVLGDSIGQGSDAVFVFNAYGSPPCICYYVFGTNYFSQGTASVDDDVCTIKIPTSNLQSGEYIVVIQHPMNDKLFNVKVVSDGGGYMAKSYSTQGDGTLSKNAKETSAINTRQSANAAESLCTLINSEYIDDMCTIESFTVTSTYLNINSLGSKPYGSKFTIGGTTNVEAGKTVTVEITSSSFSSVSKSGTSDSTDIVKTTKVISGVNGLNVWAVEIDEILAADTYTVTAEIDGVTPATGTFSIVEETQTAIKTVTATQTATAKPTAAQTKSAGFGAAALFVGLGIVLGLRKL
ncbi:MAG: hypothetical protein Q4Q53_09080 [Methanocorpusculum sp.]|nr:hypothetical protein [Methanocorpusculum sp.]